MASRIQTATNGTGFTNVTQLQAAFGSDVTAGNTVVVIVRSTDGAVDTISDSLGTTYTLRASNVVHDPAIHIYTGVLGSSGANTITVDFSALNWFRWIYCIEYDLDGESDPFDVADDKNNAGGVTDLTSDPFSTSQDLTVVVLAASQNNQPITYTAGTDFTLVDGSIGNPMGTEKFGGVEEYFTSAQLSSYTAHITSNITNQYTIVLVALKIAGGSPGGSNTGTGAASGSWSGGGVFAS